MVKLHEKLQKIKKMVNQWKNWDKAHVFSQSPSRNLRAPRRDAGSATDVGRTTRSAVPPPP